MGRYSAYINSITHLQQKRKTIGMSIFNVLIENSKPFTPGDTLEVYPFVQEAIQTLTKKGYDFIFITGQPPLRTRDIEINDFENILASLKEMFDLMGATVKASYYTTSTDKNDFYVKPNTGMFEKAQNEGKINWNETFYIGTDKNDLKVANTIKTTPILIGTFTEDNLPGIKSKLNAQHFDNILEFAKVV